MPSSNGLVVLTGDSEMRLGDATMRRVILCAGTGCMANGAMKVFERFRKEMDGAGLNVVLELRPEAGDRDVRLSKSGRIVNGVGTDPDIVAASAKAYLAALNKLHSKVEKLNPQLGSI